MTAETVPAGPPFIHTQDKVRPDTVIGIGLSVKGV